MAFREWSIDCQSEREGKFPAKAQRRKEIKKGLLVAASNQIRFTADSAAELGPLPFFDVMKQAPPAESGLHSRRFGFAITKGGAR